MYANVAFRSRELCVAELLAARYAEPMGTKRGPSRPGCWPAIALVGLVACSAPGNSAKETGPSGGLDTASELVESIPYDCEVVLVATNLDGDGDLESEITSTYAVDPNFSATVDVPFEQPQFASYFDQSPYPVIDGARLMSAYEYSVGNADEDGHKPAYHNEWTYEYDAAGRLAVILAPGSGVYSFRYNADGTIAEERYGHGNPDFDTVTTFDYDANGDRILLSELHPQGSDYYEVSLFGAPRQEIQRDEFDVRISATPTRRTTASYDLDGRIVRRERDGISQISRFDGVSEMAEDFGYDSDGRLIEVAVDVGPNWVPIDGIVDYGWTIAYDAAGRPAAVDQYAGYGSQGGYTCNYAYDENGSLIAYTCGDGTDITTAHFTYRPDGNLLTYDNGLAVFTYPPDDCFD